MEEAKKFIQKYGEVTARRLAVALGQTVRATRGLLLALKDAGEVEAVRRRAGRVAVFYRLKGRGRDAYAGESQPS